jgi:hypothetical protein
VEACDTIERSVVFQYTAFSSFQLAIHRTSPHVCNMLWCLFVANSAAAHDGSATASDSTAINSAADSSSSDRSGVTTAGATDSDSLISPPNVSHNHTLCLTLHCARVARHATV